MELIENKVQYLEYITQEIDRWDLISFKFYGDASRYEDIIRANPSVPIVPILPAGIRLQIPLLKQKYKKEDLPPWRR